MMVLDKEFELKARDGVRHIIRNEYRTGEFNEETGIEGEISTDKIGIKANHKRTKKVENK